jgi:hypothetical protein
LSRPKRASRLAAVLARRNGGDGEFQVRRLCRIAADDRDARQKWALKELLGALYEGR